MTWRRIDINEIGLRTGCFHRLCRQFQRVFIAAGTSAGQTRSVFVSPGSLPYVQESLGLY